MALIQIPRTCKQDAKNTPYICQLSGWVHCRYISALLKCFLLVIDAAVMYISVRKSDTLFFPIPSSLGVLVSSCWLLWQPVNCRVLESHGNLKFLIPVNVFVMDLFQLHNYVPRVPCNSED